MKFSSLRREFVKRLSISRHSEEEVLEAIQLYRKDPIGDEADRSLSVAGSFAAESSAVNVDLRSICHLRELGVIDKDTEIRLLGAYVAGNLEYQLRNRVNENRPVEGVQLQLLTYERMKGADSIEAVPEFEEWLKLDLDGQLNSLFQE
jgi:hypothetical protein